MAITTVLDRRAIAGCYLPGGEALRNNDNGTVAADIIAPATVLIRGETITGTGGGAAPDTPTLSGARYSDTVIRLTVANAAGMTVTPYYATKAQVDAGTAWTAGTPRSGNGTMDITVSPGTNYYFEAVAADTQNSLPSNLVGPLNTSLASGGSVLAFAGFPRLMEQAKVLSDDRDETVISALYQLGIGQTLAGASMERGDTLPGTLSDYRIVGAKQEKYKDPRSGTVCEAVRVTARKMRARLARS